jgi:SAM-dependent methyltransferase
MRMAAQPCTAAPAIAWQECACLLCNGVHLTPLLESTDSRSGLRFLVVQCNRCGLAFTNPRPDPSSISQFYPDDYRCHRAKERVAKTDPLMKLLPKHGQARLLDFGCGGGDFLARMHAAGWNVTGLDSSAAAIQNVRERLKLRAHVGTLPCPLFTDACFEAITMRQSLEHTHEPLEVLRAAYRLLTPGGRLIVAAPNFDSCAAAWFGAHWFGLDVPRHLTHFIPGTLRLMLNRAGFEQVEIRQQSHRSWIRHSAERAATMPFLRSRLGSTMAAWWAALHGRAEGILAIAVHA